MQKMINQLTRQMPRLPNNIQDHHFDARNFTRKNRGFQHTNYFQNPVFYQPHGRMVPYNFSAYKS